MYAIFHTIKDLILILLYLLLQWTLLWVYITYYDKIKILEIVNRGY